VTVPSGDDQARNIAILGPSYESPMARYGSNFATQWQVFALGLVAQGFVVGAASQVVDRIFTAVLLSVVILLSERRRSSAVFGSVFSLAWTGTNSINMGRCCLLVNSSHFGCSMPHHFVSERNGCLRLSDPALMVPPFIV
jgi:hypothetical protein